MNELPVRAIRPNPTQPRKRFNEKALEELAQSLVRHGMIQPIVVRPRDGYYEIIAGERRYQAASRAGFERVPVLVIEADETRVMELALIENIQRADLSAIEEAMAYAEMIEEFGITQAELAQRVGKSRSHITNSLRLLQLPLLVQQAVMDERLSMGHARALLSLKHPKKIEQMAERVMAENWNVRRLEQALRERKNPLVRNKRPLSNSSKSRFAKNTGRRYGSNKANKQGNSRLILQMKTTSIGCSTCYYLNRINEKEAFR